ncbi:MAG: hypothetical protein AAGG38_09730 [Planctomycetota bacterium]
MVETRGGRWPDVLVGGFAVLVVVALGLVVLGRRGCAGGGGDKDVRSAIQMRTVYQSMLVYGFDHGGYLPGLGAGGELVANAPGARFEMLVAGGYVGADAVVRPEDAARGRGYSYGLADLSEPGGRRSSWTVEPTPGAVMLAERPGRFTPGGGGWAVFHEPGLGGLLGTAEGSEDAVRLRNPRRLAGPWVARADGTRDRLFEAEGADDAYIIFADVE